MAYRGPQETAQQLLNTNVNNGNPNGAYNAKGVNSMNVSRLPGESAMAWMARVNNSRNAAPGQPDQSKPMPQDQSKPMPPARPNLSKPMPGIPGIQPVPPAVQDTDTLGGGQGPVSDTFQPSRDALQDNAGVPSGPPDINTMIRDIIDRRRGGGSNMRGDDITRYASPTVDPEGRVTNNYNRFYLPQFEGAGPNTYLGSGINPNDYLRNMFGPEASMTPGGQGAPVGPRPMRAQDQNLLDLLRRIIEQRQGGGG